LAGVARYHDELAQLMCKHKGKTFTAGQIKQMFRDAYPDLRDDFVAPSDHCINHTCKEACDCAGTDRAIFSRPRRNTYIVL